MVDFDEVSFAVQALIVAYLLCRCRANRPSLPNLSLHIHDQDEPECRRVCHLTCNRAAIPIAFLIEGNARNLVPEQKIVALHE
jgi:hypothetical protein